MHCSVQSVSSSAATRGRVGGPPARAAGRRGIAAVQPRAEKGFGGSGGKQKSGGQQKVSRRGKTASRPSPEKQLKELQADEAAYRAEMEAKWAAKQQQQALPQQQQAQQQQAPLQPPPPAAASSSDVPGSSYGSSEAIPQVVSDRMLRRIVVCAGTPVFLGISLFPLFYWIKVKEGIDLPTWVVYIVQTLTFGGGLLGITYGAMSASWDPRREGSLLGWTEFRANLPLLLDRFKRQ